jgi:hypothetical protein
VGVLDFTLPGSDPNTPNAWVQTPEQVARMQAMADALMKSGSDTSPIRSPWQGAARLAQTLSGMYGNYKADQAQRLGAADATAQYGNGLGIDPGAANAANIPATPGQTTPALQFSDQRNDAFADAADGTSPNAPLAAALGGGAAPAAAPAPAAPALAAALGAVPPAAAPRAINGGDMAPYRESIAKIESGGNYGAVGPPTGNDRPYGKYQVMGANIPAWTKAALGRAMTPQEFLANPAAQDAVFDHQFGGYLKQYGPQDAASMWISGKTLAGGGARAKDVNGTTGQSYADQFARNLGAAPAAQAISAATGGGQAALDRDAAEGNKYLDAKAKAAGTAGNISEAEAIRIATGGAPPAYAPTSSPAASQAPPGGPGGAGGIPTPAPSPAAAPAPARPAAAAVAPPAAAAALGGLHPDVQSLLAVMSNPWATPGQQQIASALLSTLMPTPPTYAVIGKDPITGNEQYGWINPKTQTVTPVSGGSAVAGGGALAAPGGAPAPAAGGATPAAAPAPASAPPAAAPQTVAGAVNLAEANGLTPQGDAYLTQMETADGASPVVARQARAIINGQAPLPEANAATKPIDIAIRDAVFRAAPQFNSSLAAARVEAVKAFADKTSATSPGGMILAANTALHHLNELKNSSDQIGGANSSYLPNSAINWVHNELLAHGENAKALSAFEFNKQALIGELAKIYKGGTPAASEIADMEKSLSANASPAEREAVMQKMATLLQGKTTELQRQWKSAFGEKSSYPVIGEEGQQVIKRFGGGGESSAPAATAAAPARLDPANPDAAYAALPSGARFVGPDGKLRVKP